MKKVLIIPGNTFVSRNFFSSPFIENLKRLSVKDNVKIIVAETEGNPVREETFNKLKKIFEEDLNIQFVKLADKPYSLLSRFIFPALNRLKECIS